MGNSVFIPLVSDPTTTIPITSNQNNTLPNDNITNTTKPVYKTEYEQITINNNIQTTKSTITTIPMNILDLSNKPINECSPYIPLSTDQCNSLDNCIYALNNCYNITLDKIGIITNTNIDCFTSKNKNNTYTLIFKTSKIGMIFIIKKIEFTIKKINDTTGLQNTADNILVATLINLDLKNNDNKNKVYIIDPNGTLIITFKINNDNTNFDFTEIKLTDINNKTLILTSSGNINKIFNKKFITNFNKVIYDNSIAFKTQDIYYNINNNIKKLIN